MAQYPTSPAPQNPYSITANWKTITSPYDSGKEQRRQKQTYAKYDVTLAYNALSSANFQALWNFYAAQKGAYGAFYFYTLESADWDGIFIGTGDAANTAFDIPGKSTSAHVIYKNGLVVAAADYTISAGGGAESADKITFDVAPVANAIITCDFTGFMRIRCRFEEDKLSKEGFAGRLYKTGIKLKGLAAL